MRKPKQELGSLPARLPEGLRGGSGQQHGGFVWEWRQRSHGGGRRALVDGGRGGMRRGGWVGDCCHGGKVRAVRLQRHQDTGWGHAAWTGLPASGARRAVLCRLQRTAAQGQAAAKQAGRRAAEARNFSWPESCPHVWIVSFHSAELLSVEVERDRDCLTERLHMGIRGGVRSW